MIKEKRLGRGLEALLGNFSPPADEANAENSRVENGVNAPQCVPLSSIELNPYQPRKEFDEAELDALSASLETHGLLQPLVVRRNGERYQLIAGERRLRAATRAAWREIPVHIIEADERQMAEIALVENLQRRDLNALEKAAALANYLKIHGGTHEDLARRLSMERASVTNLLRLLELPESIQKLVHNETISAGHARAILSLNAEDQEVFVERIIKENWNVRDTETAVKDWQKQRALEMSSDGEARSAEFVSNVISSAWGTVDCDGNRKPLATSSAQTLQLEQELRSALGTKVSLTHKNGKGKIVIPFSSHAEFERLYALLATSANKKFA